MCLQESLGLPFAYQIYFPRKDPIQCGGSVDMDEPRCWNQTNTVLSLLAFRCVGNMPDALGDPQVLNELFWVLLEEGDPGVQLQRDEKNVREVVCDPLSCNPPYSF